MKSLTRTTAKGRHRLVAVALIAAVTALGGSTLATPSIASAEPKGSAKSYDECVARGSNQRLCCSLAGGDWTETKHYDAQGHYLGSTYDCKNLAVQHRPPTMSPGDITATFLPAAPV
ncbi:MAG TPA: hypothetical protein VE666_00690 [Mycobacterium sp.]|nr:hypothetical protein [Mycobacterium sp.]